MFCIRALYSSKEGEKKREKHILVRRKRNTADKELAGFLPKHYFLPKH